MEHKSFLGLHEGYIIWFKDRHLKKKNIKMLIIDEADEMLSKGFKEQVYDIYRYLPVNT